MEISFTFTSMIKVWDTRGRQRNDQDTERNPQMVWTSRADEQMKECQNILYGVKVNGRIWEPEEDMVQLSKSNT